MLGLIPFVGIIGISLVHTFDYERIQRKSFKLGQYLKKTKKRNNDEQGSRPISSSDDSGYDPGIAQSMQADIDKLRVLQPMGKDPAHFSSHDSQPETSEVGVMFQQLGKRNSTESLREQLEKIADLGNKEKWLIHGSTLHIIQGEIMGAGTFGIVVRGLLHDIPVAVKVPRLSDMGSTDSYLHELANELRILRSLQHPNIVSFLGACVEAEVGDLALILELVEGPTVHDYVLDSKAVPSYVERYALVMGICSGLCYLHRQSPPEHGAGATYFKRTMHTGPPRLSKSFANTRQDYND